MCVQCMSVSSAFALYRIALHEWRIVHHIGVRLNEYNRNDHSNSYKSLRYISLRFLHGDYDSR